MESTPRRDERTDNNNPQHASATDEREQRDELAQRREQSYQRPQLTRRELEDRWPIG